jgi:hypothetical protein
MPRNCYKTKEVKIGRWLLGVTFGFHKLDWRLGGYVSFDNIGWPEADAVTYVGPFILCAHAMRVIKP